MAASTPDVLVVAESRHHSKAAPGVEVTGQRLGSAPAAVCNSAVQREHLEAEVMVQRLESAPAVDCSRVVQRGHFELEVTVQRSGSALAAGCSSVAQEVVKEVERAGSTSVVQEQRSELEEGAVSKTVAVETQHLKVAVQPVSKAEEAAQLEAWAHCSLVASTVAVVAGKQQYWEAVVEAVSKAAQVEVSEQHSVAVRSEHS